MSVITPFRSSRKGQVALVLLIIAALGIILYAASLNLGRMSDVKTLTIKGATASVTSLFSYLASRGEMYIRSQLKGNTTKCWPADWVRLIFFVVAGAIFVFATGGAALAVAALIMSIAAVGVSVFYNDPKITSEWNKMMENMEPVDRFVEDGIRVALEASMNDIKMVEDKWDIDADGAFDDKASRFSYHYTYRLREMNPGNLAIIREFYAALKEFLEKGDDGFGLHDHWEECPGDSPYCDPCCIPEKLEVPFYSLLIPFYPSKATFKVPGRPEECPSYVKDRCNTVFDSGGWRGNDYWYLYDTALNNPHNNYPLPPSLAELKEGHAEFFAANPDFSEEEDLHYIDTNGSENDYGYFLGRYHAGFISDSEFLGEDDPHKEFKKTDDGEFYDPQEDVEDNQFRETDVRNFVYWFAYSDPADETQMRVELKSTGLFKLLDQLRYYGAPIRHLRNEDPDRSVFEDYDKHGWDPWDQYKCYWCSGDKISNDECAEDPDNILEELEAECEGAEGEGLLPYYGNENYVENCIDANFDTLENMDSAFVKFNECAQQTGPWFKPGVDRYCNDEWPYAFLCPQYGFCEGDMMYTESGRPIGTLTESCGGCGDEGAADPNDIYFTDDPLDETVYGLDEFVNWARELLDMSPRIIHANFDTISEEMRRWLLIPGIDGEPCTDDGAPFDPNNRCIDLENEALLARFMEYFRKWESSLSAFRGGTPPSAGTTCNIQDEDYVWCSPPNECFGITEEEAGRLDATSDPYSRVRACTHDNVGNAGKFQACQDSCLAMEEDPRGSGEWTGACSETELPRSLRWHHLYDEVYDCSGVGYDSVEDCPGTTCNQTSCSYEKFRYHKTDAEEFEACFSECTEEGCEEAVALSADWELYFPKRPDWGDKKYDPLDKYFTSEHQECLDEMNPPDLRSCNWDAKMECWKKPSGRSIDPRHELTYVESAYRCLDDIRDRDTGDCGEIDDKVYPGSGVSDCRAGYDSDECNAFVEWLTGITEDWQTDACTREFYDLLEEDSSFECTGEFKQAVQENWEKAIGHCNDGEQTILGSSEVLAKGPRSKFMEEIENSALLAQCQAPKLEKRLAHVFEVEADLNNSIDMLGQVSARFDAFLNSEAVENLRKLLKGEREVGLPNHAIYGWQSDPDPGEPEGSGAWHLVRVDSRIPGRCYMGESPKLGGGCGFMGEEDPGGIPRTKTYAKAWGIIPKAQKCFSLGDSFGASNCDSTGEYDDFQNCFRGGEVRTRVRRWDGDKPEMAFPGGEPFWKFMYRKPTDVSAADGSVLKGCAEEDGAFMLNGPEDGCWAEANHLLEAGIETVMCGGYYGEGRDRNGRIEFRIYDCPGGAGGFDTIYVE